MVNEIGVEDVYEFGKDYQVWFMGIDLLCQGLVEVFVIGIGFVIEYFGLDVGLVCVFQVIGVCVVGDYCVDLGWCGVVLEVVDQCLQVVVGVGNQYYDIVEFWYQWFFRLFRIMCLVFVLQVLM